MNASFATVRVVSPKQPAVELIQVGKSFGDFTALTPLSLQVQEGEFICLLGPSGCGKTTLLRAIAGLESVTSGQIYFNGKDVTALSAAHRDFGMVFQSYALFPHLTIAQNIAYGIKTKRPLKLARVRELLELIGLTEQANKYPDQLSGGQQQRVALARALANRPTLLLLDEPLSALDANVRTHLRAELKSLQRQLGLTIIMVTHDQEEALSLADRIVVMNHGRIEQIDSPIEIYQHPVNPFVASFVGQGTFLSQNLETQPKASGFLPHSPVLSFIRPEYVELISQSNAESISTAHAHRFVGTLEHLELLGAFYRLKIHCPALNQSIMAQIDIAQWLRQPFKTGEKLLINLPKRALLRFPNPQAA